MYGLWLYKELKTEYGFAKVEVFRKGYTASAVEIGALVGNSLNLALENLDTITAPIGKSVCSFEIYDTNQVEYDDLFTPDATAYKVVVSTKLDGGNYTTRWSGYVTPDFFAENLSYRTPISISARDNIGYLNDVDFDLDASTITIRELIQAAFNRIAEDYPMQLVFATQKQTAEGVLAIDATISTMLLREGTWYEAIETILHDLGLQMRWVDNNTIAVLDLSQIPEYYPTQGFNFIDASGYREILPAWRELSQEQDYGVLDNFYKGQIDGENKLEYAANSAISSNVLLYQPKAITQWNRQGEIYFLNFFNSYNAEIGDDKQDSIYITGVAPSVTNADVLNQKMVYSQAVTEVDKQIKMTFSLNDTLRTPLTSQYSRGERNTLYLPYSAASGTTMIRIPQPYQLKYRFNIFLRANDGTNYVMRDKWEGLSTMTEQPFIEFLTDKLQTIDTGVTDGQGNHRFAFTGYDNSKEYSIIVGSIPKAGTLEFVVYPWTFEKDDYTSTRDEATFQRGAKITDIVFSVQVGKTGVSARTQVGVSHNIKSNVDYKFGQVPQREGDVITYAGGLFQSDTITALQGFQRNANATNYNLLELVGREVIHFNKKNYNKLSGTIRNLAKEPLMFNRLFVREGKKYAPFAYSLNVISNEMSITTMQEVEEYTTEQFSEINSVVTTGGATVGGGGNNTILQYSQDAGNTKRIYELSAATEQEKADAWVMVDNNGFGEAKKVNLKELGGLDEAELDFYLKNNHYVTENWVDSKGYATTESVANTYATKTQLGALEASHNSLRTEFDALNTLLNDDVSGKIDTWREVVDFLDEYSDSQDLATILAGLSGDIANRVLYEDFEKLEETVEGNRESIGTINSKVGTLEGYFNNGVAKDSAKLGGQLPSHYATASALGATNDNVTALTTRVGNAETAITTIQGNYVDKGSAQEISGVKTFKNGLKIGGAELVWDDTVKALKIIGNTYITENFSFGGYEEPEGGGSGGAGIVTIRVNGVDYSSYNGLVELPDYPSLAGYATESYVTTRGYITASALSGYATEDFVTTRGYITSSALNGYATEKWVTDKGYLTSHQDISHLLSKTDAANTYQPKGNYLTSVSWDTVSGKPSFATVATSGKYSDLSGLPTIPTNNNQLTNGAGYITGINSSMVTNALGYTPYDTSNPSGYITSAALNGYATQSWVDANYLGLGGGTISGDPALITLRANRSGADSWVQFTDAGTLDLYAIGIRRPAETYGLQYRVNDNYYKIIHEGNYSSYALPLSGGTINSDSYVPLILNANSNQSRMQFQTQGVDKALVGWSSSEGAWLYSYPSGCYLHIKDDGTPCYNGNPLIHSGNIGSYNAGSATKLQTDRYLWGNYFNGEQNISDTLYLNSGANGIYIHAEGINYHDSSNGWIALNIGCMSDGGVRLSPYNGNVFIGTISDYGARLQIGGQGLGETSKVLVLEKYIGQTLELVATTEGYYAYNSIVSSFPNRGASGCTIHFFAKETAFTEGFANRDSSINLDAGSVTIGSWAEWGVYLDRLGNITAKGNLTVSGDLAFASDARLKDNITTVSAEESINILRQLRPTTWNWKKDGNRSYGLIAQEVLPILPAMVTEGEHLHLQYNHLHAFEIGAIQHIDTEVEQLKKKVAELENELKQYRRV